MFIGRKSLSYEEGFYAIIHGAGFMWIGTSSLILFRYAGFIKIFSFSISSSIKEKYF